MEHIIGSIKAKTPFQFKSERRLCAFCLSDSWHSAGNNYTIPRVAMLEIARIIGVDSLGYLPVEQLGALIGQAHYCGACFTGLYPTPVPVNTRKDRFDQKLSAEHAVTLHP